MNFTEGPDRIADQGDAAEEGDVVTIGDARAMVKYTVIKQYYPRSIHHQAVKKKKRDISAHEFAEYLVEEGYLKPPLN